MDGIEYLSSILNDKPGRLGSFTSIPNRRTRTQQGGNIGPLGNVLLPSVVFSIKRYG